MPRALKKESKKPLPPKLGSESGMTRRVAVFSLLLGPFLCPPALPQAPTPGIPPPKQDRSYHLLREEDDWSFLADPAKRQEFWDPIKYIRLCVSRHLKCNQRGQRRAI